MIRRLLTLAVVPLLALLGGLAAAGDDVLWIAAQEGDR